MPPASSPGDGDAGGVHDPTVGRTRLPNGVTVVTETVPGMRSVALGCFVGVGSRDERDHLAGASHCLEHLLFKGSDRRSAREIAEAVDRVGGDLNAYTTREFTAFHCRVPATELDLAADLVTEVVARPGFDAGHLDAERQVILEELAMHEDAPDDLVQTRLDAALFPGHPLGREVMGDPATIEAITVDDLHAFHAAWYRPANLVVAAAGGVEHDRVVERVASAFGDEPGHPPVRFPPSQPPDALVVVTRPTEQVQLALGWRALDHADPDRYALALANEVVGGGLSSRLFQEVREARGLAYAVYSGMSSYVDAGAFVVSAATSRRRFGELVAVLDDELARLVADGVTEQELEVARSGFEGATILGLEDSGSRMGRIGVGQTIRGWVLSIDAYLAAIEAVTIDDVHRVLRRVLGSPGTRAVVGPVDPDDLA